MIALQAGGVALCAALLLATLLPDAPDTPLWMRVDCPDLNVSFFVGATEDWHPARWAGTVEDYVSEAAPFTPEWWYRTDPLTALDAIEERLNRLTWGVEFAAIAAAHQGRELANA